MIMDKPAPRLPLQLSIEFRKNYSRKADYGDLKNISLTGAFLTHESTDEMLINDKINIHFKVSGRERTLNATVVWLGESGCGLQFHPDNNRDVQIVDDLMYFVKGRRVKNKTVLDQIFSKVG
jgi:hypothetical protein